MNAEQIRKWRKEHPAEFRAGKRRENLMARHHLTLAGYKKLFAKQNGVCKRCGHSEVPGRNLSVAHDWKTGKIIGLLCTSCNKHRPQRPHKAVVN